ncbi:MAG: RNA-binding S4 domain-containing protein [Prevotella sp.]|nr:RNA-binding S4 domain-containing protein [Staphylococcus sp.]MCM1350874.1 RNA-binding S4 domain-containing protein [Prevotella sp.]
MEEVRIHTNAIKLSQFLKLTGLVYTGGETKEFINRNSVFVNGNIEKCKGKQLQLGDVITINDKKYILVSEKCL